MTTIKDDLIAIKAAVAAIPTTAIPSAPVDLSPVLTTVGNVDTKVTAIAAELVETPVASPSA